MKKFESIIFFGGGFPTYTYSVDDPLTEYTDSAGLLVDLSDEINAAGFHRKAFDVSGRLAGITAEQARVFVTLYTSSKSFYCCHEKMEKHQ